LCRRIMLKMHLIRSEPLAQPGAVIDGERELAAQLIWSREGGGTEERLARLNIGSRRDLNGFVLTFSRRRLEAEEMDRQVHDLSALRRWAIYRHDERVDSVKLRPCRAHRSGSTSPSLLQPLAKRTGPTRPRRVTSFPDSTSVTGALFLPRRTFVSLITTTSYPLQ
jgi:hypothetical protein